LLPVYRAQAVSKIGKEINMKIVYNRIIRTALFAGLLFGGLAIAAAQDPASPTPDNTKVNERDRNANEPTADQQKENRSDRNITQQVRQALVKDKSLSTYAHNVKVITQNGRVTLKGPVRSEEEKKAVEAKAEEVAGAGKVTDQLDVKPKN
jgi:hyperosmotically inducible protein